MVGQSQFYNLKIIRNINSMKLKLLILSLSFLLISCGGPPSEDSKTTIMDVVKYLQQIEMKDVNKWQAKVHGLSEDDFGDDEIKDNEKLCGKFERYEPKIVSMIGAIEGGTIYMSFVPQKENTLKEKTLNLSYSEFISQVREGQIESVIIESDGKTISGAYKNGNTFSTYRLNDPKLVDDLLSNNVEILTRPPPRSQTSCVIEVYKYSDKGAAILHAKSSWLEKVPLSEYSIGCYAKGYFIFCRFPPELMHDF